MDDSVLFNDLGPSKPPSASFYDDMFDSYFNDADEAPEPSPKASSSPSTPPPVFDKPVFDDDPDTADPFDAIPLFGGGGGGEGEDFLGGVGSAAKPERRESEAVGFDEDLLPGLGGSTNSTEEPVREVERDRQPVGFDDDLVPGFDRSMKPAPQMEPVAFDDGVIPDIGGGTSHPYSAREEPIIRQESESISSSKMSSTPEDPFVILGGTHRSGYSSFGLFSDPLNNIGMPVKEGNTKVDAPDNTSGIFQGSDIFTDFPKAMPPFSFTSENQSDINERRYAENINSMSLSDRTLNPFAGEDDLLEANQSSQRPNDVWVTVSDIALVTLPRSAPPPSRPPPPLAAKKPPTESVNRNQGYHHSACSNTSKTSQIDELEDFFMAKPANFANGHPQVLKHEGNGHYPSAATASFMDWTEMGHSKGGNQGAFDSMFTSNQYRQPEIDEKAEVCAHEMETTDEEERLENERIQREHKEEQRRAEREREEQLEREREKVRQREQEEQRRREKEREARQAVDKAVREARERAAAEARMRAEKEARQRAERAAVWKATTEARERAAVEARERAAKAAAEAKEREAAEARERAAKQRKELPGLLLKLEKRKQQNFRRKLLQKLGQKLSELLLRKLQQKHEGGLKEQLSRVAAEARQRAANEARERAAAEARARENQQRRATAEPDLESFFGMPSRSSSVPRSYNNTTTNPFDVQPHGNADSGGVRTSSSSASSFTQSSSSNLMDGLSSIFGAPSSSAVFQEVDGESEERRKARLERHQRTMGRAAKALAEKNERDLQAQREQEERHRIGESLDFEIKRWAAGKEGNLRALLSTLQYILWPECGWRPISLTDLITAASVKKEYRKATLCIHPDKVQQKGANLQQKYIAEKFSQHFNYKSSLLLLCF
ncbi:unnamed protein product [Miscanthus lutarioriparius]|uniref:Uncharacterized protein n=1 Tax=Miscanthus lutarioriparius TaxID=422564 RepID=A0A811SMY5_9POAL|nr:unnamed protein product [Miscanthus lutarioriparius]